LSLTLIGFKIAYCTEYDANQHNNEFISVYNMINKNIYLNTISGIKYISNFCFIKKTSTFEYEYINNDMSVYKNIIKHMIDVHYPVYSKLTDYELLGQTDHVNTSLLGVICENTTDVATFKLLCPFDTFLFEIDEFGIHL
jgi:hypothetical protein